jgi:dethiobiotin synthetase
MTQYFITASGTGIGKTLLTSSLTAQLRAQGKQVHALKPVISGFDMAHAQESDSGHLLRAQGLAVTKTHLDAISPWRFAAPLSPDMAAQDEGRAIDFEALLAFCRQPRDGITLIEGVGGVMVPLNTRHTVLDWMAALGAPVIVLGGSYLGAISHTLTACHAVLSCGLQLKTVILSESASQDVGLERTAGSVRRFLPATTRLVTVPRLPAIAGLDSLPQVWESMPDVTGCIL